MKTHRFDSADRVTADAQSGKILHVSEDGGIRRYRLVAGSGDGSSRFEQWHRRDTDQEVPLPAYAGVSP
ncbi:MAG TPA: hypothetical protein VKB40_00270 [Candidatus Acidoferrales bacterium]|nr:hypothetical protein [Candidatus Acidoferrales bacterium]